MVFAEPLLAICTDQVHAAADLPSKQIGITFASSTSRVPNVSGLSWVQVPLEEHMQPLSSTHQR